MFFTTLAVNDPSAYVMLKPQTYQMTKANFYASQFKLITDRYMSLVSQFSTQPFQLSFVKVMSTHSGVSLTFPGQIVSVTKQASTKLKACLLHFIITV
jgi:hypothetical protein